MNDETNVTGGDNTIVTAAPTKKKRKRKKKRQRALRSDAGVKRGPMVEASSSESPQTSEVRREPFGSFQDKLAVYNKDPNYFYFWHAERGDDIERALAAGYRFVTRREAGRELPEALRSQDEREREDGPMRIHGGAGDYGRAYKLVLMRIPLELHEQDKAARAKKADVVDSSIMRKSIDGVEDELVYGDVSGITTKVGVDADR